MSRLTDYIRGVYLARLRGCAPERCLDALLRAGIPVWAVKKTGDYTLTLRLRRADADAARDIICRCQCEAEFTALRSARRDAARLRTRLALLLGLPLALVLAIVVSNTVVRVDIRGCEAVEEIRVRRALDTLGVRFGAWGPSLNSEQIRNGMLRLVPELRWVGVNWSGMRADVQVAERTRPRAPTLRTGAADLIACTDGVITEVEALNGQALCAPGDAVRAGDVLISGMVDLERLRVATRALGEVYADTRRAVEVRTPAYRTQFEAEGPASVCLWLCAGRKRIKIFGNSGIMMDGCVKMISRGTMRLPGGVEVPLGLCIETCRPAVRRSAPLEEGAAARLLERCADRLLAEAMVAGRVTAADTALRTDGGVYRLIKTAHCREMIARSAEIPILELEQHGKSDQRGTDGTAH